MYEYNLLHLAASVLLAGTVDVLLHFLRLCGLDAIRLLRLLERIFVCLYILCRMRLHQLVRLMRHTIRLCLIFSFCSRIRAIRAASSSSLNLSYTDLTYHFSMHLNADATYPLCTSSLDALRIDIGLLLLLELLLAFRCG